MPQFLPYNIAVLCYLFDSNDRTLLLHRYKSPNQDLYSPVGGKLEQPRGESPTGCAVREIREETGLHLSLADLHLTGIVSEDGYEDSAHWLMFLYEVTHPVEVTPGQCAEGNLDWHNLSEIDALPIPETDRKVIWPLFRRFRRKFFAAHIHCAGGRINWRIEQPPEAAEIGSQPIGAQNP